MPSGVEDDAQRGHDDMPSADTSDAAWFHAALVRVGAALDAGDDAEVQRLRGYVRREGGEKLLNLLDSVLAARAHVLAGDTRIHAVGLTAPGQKICDFCAAESVVAYYPFDEFSIETVGGAYLSGDRMYVCGRCHELVEAGNWKALRDWVGPGASGLGVRMLWSGFRSNRTGPAVPIPPGAADR